MLNQIRTPATITIEKLGDRIVANIVIVGAVLEIMRIISKLVIKKTVIDTIPLNLKESNLKAIQSGFNIGKEIIKSTN